VSELHPEVFFHLYKIPAARVSMCVSFSLVINICDNNFVAESKSEKIGVDVKGNAQLISGKECLIKGIGTLDFISLSLISFERAWKH
jgi:hypothetical protein